MYKLQSGAMESNDGKVDYPYGKAAVGYLFYLENGMMSFHMMASDRKPFAQYGLHGGSPQDNDAAFRTSLSFCGRYSIEGDEI